MIPVSALTSVPPAQTTPDDKDRALRQAATELEAAFLTEMLKSAGLGEASAGFGGGAGESQFSSFLIREQAQLMVAAGGIGLAESLFHALKEKQDDP